MNPKELKLFIESSKGTKQITALADNSTKIRQLLGNASSAKAHVIKENKKMHSVAILYQAINPPNINGIRKPMKVGGYSDSGADIAFILKRLNVPVITPVNNPSPEKQFDWIFPDTEVGIQSAISRGADVLWANTVLFEGHPLEKITDKSGISIIGHSPFLVQKYDDKWIANTELRLAGLTVAPSCLVSSMSDLTQSRLTSERLTFPLVVKPIRGRGSQGVYVVNSFAELKKQIESLSAESDKVESEIVARYGQSFIVEQYMSGQEITITVMPPGIYNIKGKMQNRDYWSLPIVKRFNHVNGIAPYNGDIAVTSNSALLNESEMNDQRYAVIQQECEKAAQLVGAKSPIRIDCREGQDGKFYLFDLNMKPNMTGPGRPSREDQDSLSSIAARSKLIGWDYGNFLLNIYAQAWPANTMVKHVNIVNTTQQKKDIENKNEYSIRSRL